MRLALIHSPLLGPSSLEPTAAELRALGLEAAVIRLPSLLEIGGGYYEELAAAAARQVSKTEDAVLVVHSGAGALAPVIVSTLGAVKGVIFVDAILPHPGRSWLDTAPASMRAQLVGGAQQGLLPAWDGWWPPGALERLVPEAAVRDAVIAELEPLPLAFFEEAAPDIGLETPCGYLQLSGSYDEEARRGGRLGWPVVRLPLNHLACVSQPQAVAGALEGLVRRLAP